MLEIEKEYARSLVKQMTLEEKAGLCSGATCWDLKAINRLGLESVCVMDGPHGLRKQVGSTDNLGIGVSKPAVCFPTASALACSFDRNLLYEVAKSIGEECIAEGVSGLLGPGINMKRSPLCGRNFEYFSEDPFLAGELAVAFIQGAESTGTATSLKHFAVNNQEKRRMTVNAMIDERTLREIYLRAFERAVKKGKPSTVMCSYNKVNGIYASENEYLLTKILREEWGFEGVTISDWGAVHDRVMGVKAGLDLEMPSSNGANDKKIVEAVRSGRLSEEKLDETATRITHFILKSMKNTNNTYCDYEKHHTLAVKASRESMVLLKNENEILPLKKSDRIAIIGEFAMNPRIQGAGSSKINPIRVDTPLECIKQSGISYLYAQGYRLSSETSEDISLLAEAVATAKKMDKVLLFAGLPEGKESEGFDRETMELPTIQNKIIEEVSKVNKNVIVVLIGGAPVSLPWKEQVQGIMLAYLGGEGMGQAITELLMGTDSPCGKLAETWPIAVTDTPCADTFPGTGHLAVYDEGIYIGYRFYEKKHTRVQFPFGYGLSYTTFHYRDISVMLEDGKIKIRFIITNTGAIRAGHSVLIFIKNAKCNTHRPERELRDFVKVFLEPGESEKIECIIDESNLGYYDVRTKSFVTPAGEYEVQIVGDKAKVEASTTVFLKHQNENQNEDQNKEQNKDTSESSTDVSYYDTLIETEQGCKRKSFEALMGKKIYHETTTLKPYTTDNTLEDVQKTWTAKLLIMFAKHMIKRETKKEKEQMGMMLATIMEMPLYALAMSSGDMISEAMMNGLVMMMNGNYFKGICLIFKKE